MIYFVEMTGINLFRYHVPRLKLRNCWDNRLSVSVVKIVILIFFLGLIAAASQDSEVLKFSAQDFSRDFQGKPDTISYLPLPSASSLRSESEDEGYSFFESRKLIMSQLGLSLNNDVLKKNDNDSHSLVPTRTQIQSLSSTNKSKMTKKQVDTVLSEHKILKIQEEFRKEIGELIPSEQNSVKGISPKELGPYEARNRVETDIAFAKKVNNKSKISTLLQAQNLSTFGNGNSAFHSRSHNIWANPSILENQLVDEEARLVSHDVNNDEENWTSSVNDRKYLVKRPRRSVVKLHDMIACGTGCNPLAYKGYGCYCGFLGSGIPVDGIDRCCAKHDWCYHHAKCPMIFHYFVSYRFICDDGRPKCAGDYRGWKGICGTHLCECDRQFAQCLRKYPCPRSRAMCMTSPWRFWQNLVMQPPLRSYG